MKKIVEFWKKNYKVLIPIMVVLVLLITVYFLYREYKYDSYRNKQENMVYQYFGGVKREYTAIVTYNLNDIIVDVKPKDEKIQYDATPIYFKNEDKVLFPKDMSIVFPLKDGSQYKIYKYSMYEKINDEYKIRMNNEIYEGSYFFLYDGKSLFFFPDEVDLYINNKKKITLGANSYAQVVGGYTLIYYDKNSDNSSVIELNKDEVMVKNDKMTINLNEAVVTVQGKKLLLFNPYNLNVLSRDK